MGLFARLREMVEGGVMLEDPEAVRFEADWGEEFAERRLWLEAGGGVCAELSRCDATRVDFLRA